MMRYNRFTVVCGLAVVLMAGCATGTPATLIPSVEPSAAATATLTLTSTGTPIPPTDPPDPTQTPRSTFTPRPSRTPTRTLTPTNTPRPSLGSGPFRAVAMVDGVIPGEVGGLITTPDDRLWLYSDQAVALLQADETWSVYLPEYDGSFAGVDVMGRVWIIDDDLIAAWDGQNWTRYGEESGWEPLGSGWWYSSSPVQSGPYMDSPGRLWLATTRDIRAFDGQQWFIFGPEAMGMERPDYDDTGTAYQIEVEQDRIWVGECDMIGPGPGHGEGVRWFDGEWQGSDSPLATGCVTAIAIDPAGSLWFGQKLTLWQTDSNSEVWTSISMPDQVLGDWNFGYPIDLKIDSEGGVWATYIMCGGASCSGPLKVYHIEGGIWTEVATTDQDPFPSALVLMLGVDGTPWLFSIEGINRVIDNRGEPAADLFARFVAQGPNGRIWFIAEQNGQNWLWTDE